MVSVWWDRLRRSRHDADASTEGAAGACAAAVGGVLSAAPGRPRAREQLRASGRPRARGQRRIPPSTAHRLPRRRRQRQLRPRRCVRSDGSSASLRPCIFGCIRSIGHQEYRSSPTDMGPGVSSRTDAVSHLSAACTTVPSARFQGAKMVIVVECRPAACACGSKKPVPGQYLRL